MPHFDGTINLGSVIALCAMLFTFHKYHISNVKRFMKLEFKVSQMWEQFRHRFNLHDIQEDETLDGQ